MTNDARTTTEAKMNPTRMTLSGRRGDYVLRAHFEDGSVWAGRVASRAEALRAYEPGFLKSWDPAELLAHGWTQES